MIEMFLNFDSFLPFLSNRLSTEVLEMSKYFVLFSVLLLGFLLVACNQTITNSASEILSPEEEIITAENKGAAPAGQGILMARPALNFTSCIDSDGDYPYLRGAVTAKYTYGSRYGVFTYTDRCLGENKLIEYICDGNKPLTNNITCPSGCSAGACNPVVCTDSDGGQNYTKKGTAKGLVRGESYDIKVMEDYCLTSGEKAGRLVEYYCHLDEDGVQELRSISVECPVSKTCSNGSCA